VVTPDQLFGATWERLSLDHLRRFLAQAGDEGLTWEVKGDREQSRWPRPQQIEKAASGFANSALGGVLLIGVERQEPGRSWLLKGLAAPAESEIVLAVGKVMRDGLRPVPEFRVRSWELESNRHVAVLWVRPVAEPPCLTRDGRAFVRTTGQTVPVTDPTELARLFAAGDKARADAEEWARRGALRALRTGAGGPWGSERGAWEKPSVRSRSAVGLAATGYKPDIAGRLLHVDFRNRLAETCKSEFVLQHIIGMQPGVDVVVRQHRDGVSAHLSPASFGDEHAYLFAVDAHWSGAVGVASSRPKDWELHEFSSEVLRPSLRAAISCVRSLGASGQLHCCLLGEGQMTRGSGFPGADEPARAWIELPEDENRDQDLNEPPAEVVSQLDTELRRLGGEEIWEGG
jgi:hypothetical protein